jgi:hypothetical protein
MMSVVGAGGALGGDGGSLGGDGGRGGVGGEEGGGAEVALVDWFVCDALVDWFVCDADWFVCDAARAHVAASTTVRRRGAIFLHATRCEWNRRTRDFKSIFQKKEEKGMESAGKNLKRAAYRLPAWSPTAVLPILEAA